MEHTKLFLYFLSRDKELRKALLPEKRSDTGNYQNKTFERVSGYRLLIHAELEYYFEELTKRIMKKAKENWDKKHEASPTIVALMAYCSKSFVAIPESSHDQHTSVDLSQRVNDAYTEHFHYINGKNHGIKEKNILALLLPVGVTIDEIDNSLLIALNSFGAERGRIAHSTKAKLCTTPDDAETDIDNIISLLETFDCGMKTRYCIE